MRIFGIVIFCLIFSTAEAQTQLFQDTLALECDIIRRRTEKRAMVILGSWSAINITSGLILSRQTNGWESRFHTSNALWNTVNASLALGGLWRLRNEKPSGNLVSAVNKLHSAEKTFLFNAGLDLAYMVTGVYLAEASKNQSAMERKDLFLGAGRSLMLQGAFLFVFDLGAFLSVRNINRFYGSLLEGLYVGGTSLGIRKQF